MRATELKVFVNVLVQTSLSKESSLTSKGDFLENYQEKIK